MLPRRARRPAPIARQLGLTLVELMISLTIGLIILATMTAIFAGSSASRREVQLSADVIENGRYGLDVLAREVSQAGFLGALSAPAGVTVAVCSTALSDWQASLAVHAVGINQDEAAPACIARKAGTDAIFIQRASTCAVGEAQCEGESAAAAYLQVSTCGSEYSTTPLVVEMGGGSFPLHDKNCAAALAEKRKLIRRFYFVDTSDVLNQVDILPGGAAAAVPLVEGIEQLQASYAFDADGDGTPECFASKLSGCGGAQWSQVVGARIWLLARSDATSHNTGAAMQFVLDDATVDVAASSSGNLKRRVYSTYIPFVTPKSRRER